MPPLPSPGLGCFRQCPHHLRVFRPPPFVLWFPLLMPPRPITTVAMALWKVQKQPLWQRLVQLDESWQNLLTTWHPPLPESRNGLVQVCFRDVSKILQGPILYDPSLLPGLPSLLYGHHINRVGGPKRRAILSRGLQYIYNSYFWTVVATLNLSFEIQCIVFSLSAVNLGFPLSGIAFHSPQLHTLRLLSGYCYLILTDPPATNFYSHPVPSGGPQPHFHPALFQPCE